MNSSHLPIHDHTDRGIRVMEEERRRIARDLSDGPARALTDVSLHLDTVLQLFQSNPELAFAELRRTNSRIVSTVNDIHRLVYDLLPVAVDDIGFFRAMRELCHRLERDWKIQFHVLEPTQLSTIGISPAKQVALYRLLRLTLHRLHERNSLHEATIGFAATATDLITEIRLQDTVHTTLDHEKDTLDAVNEQADFMGAHIVVSSSHAGSLISISISNQGTGDTP